MKTTFENETLSSPTNGLGGDSGRRSEWVSAAKLALWVHRKRLFRVSLAATVLSVCVVLLLPNQYTATIVLAPPDTSSGSRLATMVQMVAGSDSGIAADLLGKKDSGDLLVEMLRSRILRGRIVERFNLKRLYAAHLMTDARDRLSSHTVLSQDKKSGVIIISVTDRDPHLAKAIADSYVEELNRMATESNTSAAHRERVFVESRLESVKAELQSAEKDFSEFASKNAAIDVPQQGKAMVEAAATLQGQLIAAQSELSGLEQIYSPQNVRVRALRARIEGLNRQLNRYGGSDLASDPSQGGSSVSIYPSIRQLPLLGVRYADLFRRMKVEEAVFDTLTKQSELSKIEEAKELPSIRVLDPAEIPERKSWPPRLTIVVLITSMAFAVSVGVVVGITWFRELDPDNPNRLRLELQGRQVAAYWAQIKRRFTGVSGGRTQDQ